LEVRTEKRKAASRLKKRKEISSSASLTIWAGEFANLAVGEDVAFGEEAPGANGTGDEQWEQGGL